MERSLIHEQSILAKLIVNPSYTLANIDQLDELLAPFELTNEQMLSFSTFFENYKDKFSASVQLLARKRMLDIFRAIEHIEKYLGHDKLVIYYNKYLESLEFDSVVPKNPIKESLLLLSFIKKHPSCDIVLNALSSYEYIKNDLIIDYSENNYATEKEIELDLALKSLDSSKIYIHPSNRIMQFDISISQVLNTIMKDEKLAKLDRSPEIIFFYKNLIKGGIGADKISSGYVTLIKEIRESATIEIFLTNMKNRFNLDRSKSLNILTNLNQKGTISFVEVTNE